MGRINDEQIITALLETGSQAKTARLCKCSVDTIRARLQDLAFVTRLNARQAELLQDATIRLNGAILGAIDNLVSIANNEENPPQTRLSACCKIIDTTIKLNGFVDVFEETTNERNNRKLLGF